MSLLAILKSWVAWDILEEGIYINNKVIPFFFSLKSWSISGTFMMLEISEVYISILISRRLVERKKLLNNLMIIKESIRVKWNNHCSTSFFGISWSRVSWIQCKIFMCSSRTSINHKLGKISRTTNGFPHQLSSEYYCSKTKGGDLYSYSLLTFIFPFTLLDYTTQY